MTKHSSVTSRSNRKWLEMNVLQVDRFVRHMIRSGGRYKDSDREYVYGLLFDYPDEAVKLVNNYHLSNHEKIMKFLNFLKFSPIGIGVCLGDQRSGKDVAVCFFLDQINKYFLRKDRIVTLGNTKNPPFVNEDDMYFSFMNIPTGSREREVLIYCSELDLQLPAREFQSQENRLFTHLVGTMAQNHQKLYACAKLSSVVDISYLRHLNFKIFKYINPEKLNIDGVERDNILSGLGRWLLPRDTNDRSETLLVFDNNLLTVNLPIPSWYNLDYSEMFRNIPIEKIYDFVRSQYGNGMDLNSIRIAVANKFRKVISMKDLVSLLGVEYKMKQVRI